MASQFSSSESGERVVRPSGLEWIEDALGDGEEARSGCTVKVHYTGWLEDGTEFDTSRTAANAFFFKLGASQVIAGWDEGVLGMKVGGKRRLTIPPQLGYGATGAAGVIPPNATLLFEVELLEVHPGFQP